MRKQLINQYFRCSIFTLCTQWTLAILFLTLPVTDMLRISRIWINISIDQLFVPVSIQTAHLIYSSLGCKLPRKRPHSCTAGQRQSVLRPLPRATGSQLSLRVITYKLLAVEWCVKYGHRPYSVSIRQQVNWPRRPLKIWACNISSDWICIKAPLFCPPHHLFVLEYKSGAF